MPPAAPPEHQLHQKAVRAVLGALLPGPGTDIKGHTRSRAELQEASGYGAAPAEFDGLMRVLLAETRLLTPVAADAPDDGTPAAEPRYQLTHDYLVPSVRDWLTRKRMETRRGRAELRLADRAALWQAKPEVRQLPSLTEWLTIRLLTRRRTWTEPQQRMMRAASRRHLGTVVRAAAMLILLAAATIVFRGQLAEERAAARADALVRRLLAANVAQVPEIVDELGEYRRWADPALERVLADPVAGRDRRLRARLALLPVDRRHADELRERLFNADPAEFPVLRDALAPHRADLVGPLWDVQAADGDDPARRFRAAVALATYAPADPRWEAAAPWAAGQLVLQPALVRTQWVDGLRPVKGRLLAPLGALVRDRARPSAASAAAEILGDYAADRPDVLAEALAYAAPDAFAFLFPRLRDGPGGAVPALTAALDRPAPAGEDANATAGRRANLAVALLRAGAGERLWPLLKASTDPRVRSLAIDRFASLGCDPAALVARLEAEPDDSVRAALWLALGGFDDRALRPDRRAALTPAVVKVYREDGSAAVHAAAGWLLGKWGAPAPLPPVGDADKNKGWYLNKAGQTMVRLTGPVTFQMGSPPDEPGYLDREKQHTARIDYSFDIGMTEVTVGQYRQFLGWRAAQGKGALPDKLGAPANAPATKVTWYDAAAYCNWLSEREGIDPDEWCYVPNAAGEYAEGMTVAPDYRKRTGYRLPTEAEWEFACRGGAATRRCYGDTDDLLPRYAWYAANAGEEHAPVARLLPNAYGLFDMYGNAAEWCQNAHRPYGEAEADSDAHDLAPVTSAVLRTNRGGHMYGHAKTLRSAKRFADRPSMADAGGFRLARSSP